MIPYIVAIFAAVYVLDTTAMSKLARTLLVIFMITSVIGLLMQILSGGRFSEEGGPPLTFKCVWWSSLITGFGLALFNEHKAKSAEKALAGSKKPPVIRDVT